MHVRESKFHHLCINFFNGNPNENLYIAFNLNKFKYNIIFFHCKKVVFWVFFLKIHVHYIYFQYHPFYSLMGVDLTNTPNLHRTSRQLLYNLVSANIGNTEGPDRGQLIRPINRILALTVNIIPYTVPRPTLISNKSWSAKCLSILELLASLNCIQ